MMRWERLCQHAGLKHVWKVYTTGSDPALKQTGIQRGKIKANNKTNKLSHTTIYISASCLNYPLCSVMYGRSGNSYWYGFKNTAEWKSLFSNLIVRCVCVCNCSLVHVCGFTVFVSFLNEDCLEQRAATIQFLLSHHCSLPQVKHSLAQWGFQLAVSFQPCNVCFTKLYVVTAPCGSLSFIVEKEGFFFPGIK